MQKIIILILFSLAMITMVGLALIPQMIIPEDEPNYLKVPVKLSLGQNNSTIGADCGQLADGVSCDLTMYLEENIAWVVKGGKDFCSYKLINNEDPGDPSGINYIYYVCAEFYENNGKLYEGSGAAGPIKITRTESGFDAWRPRDGDLFYRDLNNIFPEQYRKQAQELNMVDSERLRQMNRERAKKYFKADFNYKIEKITDNACSHDYECQTPGEYLMMSRCPFTSMCVNGECAVVCPDFMNINQASGNKPEAPNNEPSGPVTIKNDKYGFEFKYSKDNYEGIYLDQSVDGKILLGHHYLLVEDIKGKTVESFINEEYPQKCATYNMEIANAADCRNFDISQKKTLVGGNINAIEVHYRVVGMGRNGFATYFLKDNNLFKIGYEAMSPYFWPDLYGEMLKTFKFTN